MPLERLPPLVLTILGIITTEITNSAARDHQDRHGSVTGHEHYGSGIQ
jgi:hypothetical protein